MIVVAIPGKFMSYLDGSSLMQDDDLDNLDVQCRDAIRDGHLRPSGRGYSVIVGFPDPEVAGVLADLADICIVANYGGEVDHAEVSAARKVLARLSERGVHPL